MGTWPRPSDSFYDRVQRNPGLFSKQSPSWFNMKRKPTYLCTGESPGAILDWIVFAFYCVKGSYALDLCFHIYIYLYVCAHACMSLCVPYAYRSLQRPEWGTRSPWNWSDRQLWASVWVLGTEPTMQGQQVLLMASALVFWGILNEHDPESSCVFPSSEKCV